MPAFFVEQRFWYWVKFDLHAWGNNKRNLLWNEMGCNHIERIEIVPWVKRGQGYCLVNGLLKKKKTSVIWNKTHTKIWGMTCVILHNPSITRSQRWCALCSTRGHRQGGTAGCGTPGHNNKASLPFLLHNTSAELTQTVQRVRIQAQGGEFRPQHTGLVQQGSAAAPPARSQPQVLLGPAKPGREWFQLLEEQLLLQKTWMKPIPSPRATGTEQRAGLQAHGTAVLCYSRTGLSLCQEQLLTCAQTWAETEHHILPLSPLALLQVGTLYWKFRMLPVILTLCSTVCL